MADLLHPHKDEPFFHCGQREKVPDHYKFEFQHLCLLQALENLTNL
jgi:hypothetical protein